MKSIWEILSDLVPGAFIRSDSQVLNDIYLWFARQAVNAEETRYARTPEAKEKLRNVRA